MHALVSTRANVLPGSDGPPVYAAIAAMGHLADRKVPLGALAHFGEWLGWPDWVRRGTSHAHGHGPLPSELSVRDDLIVVANLVEQVGIIALVEAMVRCGQPAGSNLGKLAASSGPTLGDCFGLLQRTLELGSPYLSSGLKIEGDVAISVLTPKWPLGTLGDFAALCWMAHVYQTIAAIQPMALGQVVLAVTLQPGPDALRFQAMFGCSVIPGSAVNGVHFPAEWLKRANPGHDPVIWALTRERVALSLRKQDEAEQISRIRALITAAMDRDPRPPRLKQMAVAAGTSSRTLVRNLHDVGSSFHTLVEEEWRIRTLQLIGNPTLSLAEVAAASGFTDPSSFGRKFRGWFGQSPARYRIAASPKV